MDKYEARLAVCWNSFVEYEGVTYIAVELSQVHYPDRNNGKMYLHMSMACIEANCVVGAEIEKVKIKDWRMHDIYVQEKLAELRAAGEIFDRVKTPEVNRPIEGYGRWKKNQQQQ